MPTIPDEQFQVFEPKGRVVLPKSAPGKRIPTDTADILRETAVPEIQRQAKAGQQATAATQQWLEDVKGAKRVNDIHTAITKTFKDLSDFELALEKDPHGDMADRYAAESIKIQNLYAKGLDSKANKLYKQKVEYRLGPRLDRVLRRQWKRELAHQRASFIESYGDSMDTVMSSTSPADALHQITEFKGAAETLIVAGSLNPVWGTQMAELFEKQAGKGLAKRDIFTDPYLAKERLAPGEDSQEHYPGLTDGDRFSLYQEALTAVNRLEAEGKRKQAVQKDILLDQLPDNVASIKFNGEESRGFAQYEIESLLSPQEQAGYSEQVRLAWEFSTTWAKLKHAPPAEAKEILAKKHPKSKDKGFVEQFKMWKELSKAYGAERAKFDADSAAYTQAMPGVDTPEESMAMQKLLGALKPRFLSDPQRTGFQYSYEAADPRGKVELIKGFKEKYGKNAVRALSEVDLGYDHLFAALQRPEKSEVLIRVLGMKLDNFGLDAETKKNVKTATNETFFDAGIGLVLTKIASFTRNPEYSREAALLRDMALKISWLNPRLGDLEGEAPTAGKGFKAINEDYKVIDDDNFAHIWFDKNIPENLVENYLEKFRDNIESLVAHKKDKFPSVLEYKRYLKDLKEKGTWIPSSDGEGFELYNFVTGTKVKKQDGSSVKVSLTNILDEEQNPRQEQDRSYELPESSFQGPQPGPF